MTRCFSGLVACLFIVTATTADAQFFGFGPGGGISIRAPFVSVDVGPGGATSVRAPYTAVDTAGYPRHSPFYPYPHYGASVLVGPGAGAIYGVPVYPSSPGVVVESYAQPRSSVSAARPITADPATVAEQLRSSAVRLYSGLMRGGDDSDAWLKYLAPDRIVESIDRGEPAQSLSDLLRNYDGVVSNPRLDNIQRIDGFVSTRLALRQWVEIGGQLGNPRDARARAVEPKDSPDITSPESTEQLDLPSPTPVTVPDLPDVTVPEPPAANPPGGPEARTGSRPTRRSI